MALNRKSFGKIFSELRKRKKKLLISLCLLVLALLLYGASGDYTTDHGSSVSVPDLVLDHFGPYNLNFIFVWLFIAVLAAFFAYPLFFKTKDFPYAVSMFSLVLIVRSAFVIFTHLRTPYDAITTTFPGWLQLFNFSNDLFFSGHAALPFLGFLIFAENRKVRYFMLACSIVLGITVLLMHVHYTIDVLSAYFITYGTYKFGNVIFSKE